MKTSSPSLSVIDPVGRALDRVKLVLFQPFDLGKWFVIGFCAWLSLLGEGGGGGGGLSFNFPIGGSGRRGGVRHELQHARDFLGDNLYWIVPVVVGAFLLGLVFWVVFTWLNSRGRFMFLHCVALNKAEVIEPWTRFSQEANSLFLFRIVLGLISMVAILPLVVLCVVIGWGMCMAHRLAVVGVLELVGLVLAIIAFGTFFTLIEKLTTDFVVPLMYLRRRRCRACWGELLDLLRTHTGEFVLWLLFQIVLGIAIGALVTAIVFLTCCCAGCLMSLPYLGTVLLLPVLVFKRSYSLHYLAQLGIGYDVFAPAGPSPAAAS